MTQWHMSSMITQRHEMHTVIPRYFIHEKHIDWDIAMVSATPNIYETAHARCSVHHVTSWYGLNMQAVRWYITWPRHRVQSETIGFEISALEEIKDVGSILTILNSISLNWRDSLAINKMSDIFGQNLAIIRSSLIYRVFGFSRPQPFPLGRLVTRVLLYSTKQQS